MLNETLLKTGVIHARRLAEPVRNLNVLPGSALAMLVTDCEAVLEDPKASTGFAESMLGAGQSSYENEDTFINGTIWRTSLMQNDTDYSRRVLSIAEELAPIVQSHLNFAKNVVRPLYTELKEAATAFELVAKNVDPVTEFKVQIKEPPAFLYDDVFLAKGLDNIHITDMIKQTAEAAPVIEFTTMEEVDALVAEIINQGNDRLTGLVTTWLSSMDRNVIKELLLNQFGRLNGYSGLEKDCAYFYQTSIRDTADYNALDIAASTWLIANFLKENPRSTASSTDLPTWTLYYDELKDVAGAAVLHIKKKMENQLKMGTMVASLTQTAKTIVLHRPLYEQYLKDNGSPEAILGLMVSNIVLHTLPTILENQERLKQSWVEYVGIRRFEGMENYKQNFRNWLISYMELSLQKLTEAEEEVLAGQSDLRDQIMLRVKEEVERLAHNLHTDLDHTALHMVAKARFYYTSAYSILGEMLQYSRINPEVTPNEALLPTVVSYMADYFEAQFKASPVESTAKSLSPRETFGSTYHV